MIPLPDKIKNDISSQVGALEYLLQIEATPNMFIGTTKQTFGSNGTYYEDLDLKVSNISEKIDLKTKKVQYSDMTFTLSNIYQNEQYLSDRLSNAMGSNINLYLKTQSCELLDDCLLIAMLKIRKMEHNNQTVKLIANDVNLETLYVNLPKKTLEGGVDTTESGNLKPVPILYGHLEDAPAVVYIEEDQTTKLIPDDSYFADNEKEIEGVKQFYVAKQNGYDAEIIDREYDHLISPNAVKVNLGKSICDVPCLPFVNSLYTKNSNYVEDPIIQLFRTNQYETYQDHVILNNSIDYYSHESILKNYNALWISKLSDLKLSKEFSYSYYQDGTYRYDSLGLTSRWLWQSTTPDFDFMDNTETHRVGFQVYEFENIEGAERLETKISDIDIFPVDVHFIGNMNIQTYGEGVITDHIRFPRINIFFSNLKDDVVQPSHMVGGWEFGSPDEFTITNNGSAVNTNFEGRFWNTQKIELHAHSELYDEISIVDGLRNQYITYLLSDWNNNTDNGGNYWQSIYSSTVDGLRKGLSSNIMVMAYSPDMQSGWEFTENPNTDLSISTNVSDMKVRKMWANKDMMNKDFHVNAKGRVDTNIEYNNIYKIKGKIKVLTEKIIPFDDPAIPALGVRSETVAYENKHQIELFKLLTNSEYQTKFIDNDVHELMIKYEAHDGKLHYIWDIDVNNMHLSEDFGDVGFGMFTNEARPDRQGWIYDITAKNYNLGADAIPFNINDPIGYWFKNIELVYAKINWLDEATVDSIEEASVENSEELQEFNDNKGWTISHAESVVGLGYCYVIWLHENMELAYKLADTAPYIIKDLLTSEMNIDLNQIDIEKLNKAENAVKNNKMAFSVDEQKESREILENICKQSRLTFRFRPSDNFAVVDAVYDSYDLDIDFDKEINLDNSINYSFSKTKIEDLSVGGVSVNYGYDYATKKPNAEVEVALESSLEEYKAHYGIINEEDYKIEINAPFISNKQSALELANYFLNYYKNQHIVIKCSLVNKDGFELEVGDVIKINSEQNVFGIKISEITTLIDQEVYPLFYITSISKNLNKVDIECVQLHNLDQA